MSERRRALRMVFTFGLLLPMLLSGAGCSLAKRSYQPDQDPAALDDVSFLHYLANVPVATVDEGMQAIFLLTGERAQFPTFESRHERLLGRGAIKPAWHLEAGQILDKGTLAYMLRTVCNLPRGVNEVLASRTGLGDRRYALMTCVHEGLLKYSVPHEPVTGPGLHSALMQGERYLASRSPQAP